MGAVAVASVTSAEIRVWRDASGKVQANVPRVKRHATAGLECGSESAGAADLALSILNHVFPPLPFKGSPLDLADDDHRILSGRHLTARLPSGQRITAIAGRLYQRFKHEFIATMPREGGAIPVEAIETWANQAWTAVPDKRQANGVML